MQEGFDYTNFDNLGESWVKYEGDFKDDAKDGVGTLYLVNGDKFFGSFVNDRVHGKGSYHIENAQEKKVITGEWNTNKLVHTY